MSFESEVVLGLAVLGVCLLIAGAVAFAGVPKPGAVVRADAAAPSSDFIGLARQYQRRRENEREEARLKATLDTLLEAKGEAATPPAAPTPPPATPPNAR